jgi:hypothetical protein
MPRGTMSLDPQLRIIDGVSSFSFPDSTSISHIGKTPLKRNFKNFFAHVKQFQVIQFVSLASIAEG